MSRASEVLELLETSKDRVDEKGEKPYCLSEAESIKIDGRNVKAGRVINHWSGKGEVIGTVSGSKSDVKKGIEEYEGKGYDFVYFIVDKVHIVRIIDPKGGYDESKRRFRDGQ